MVGQHVEETIKASDGTKIYTKTWKSAKEPPIATVVFIHGFGEHINRYDHVFDKFAEVGIETYSYDQRGFGKTAEMKKDSQGVTGGWDLLTSDITVALKAKKRPEIPQFLYGHSMGGGLVLNYACHGPERGNVAGYLATSPLVDVAQASQPWFFKKIFARVGSWIFPNKVFNEEIDARWMSRDPKEVEKYKNDKYIKGLGSLQCFNDMATRPQALLKNKSYNNITRPVFISHGMADKVTSQPTSAQFFGNIPSSDTNNAYKYKSWPEAFHELHNDYDKDKVIQEYIDWLVARARANK